eukprot:6187436-Pleurochrysis_carterae.AAC.3
MRQRQPSPVHKDREGQLLCCLAAEANAAHVRRPDPDCVVAHARTQRRGVKLSGPCLPACQHLDEDLVSSDSLTQVRVRRHGVQGALKTSTRGRRRHRGTPPGRAPLRHDPDGRFPTENADDHFACTKIGNNK